MALPPASVGTIWSWGLNPRPSATFRCTRKKRGRKEGVGPTGQDLVCWEPNPRALWESALPSLGCPRAGSPDRKGRFPAASASGPGAARPDQEFPAGQSCQPQSGSPQSLWQGHRPPDPCAHTESLMCQNDKRPSPEDTEERVWDCWGRGSCPSIAGPIPSTQPSPLRVRLGQVCL